MTACIIIMNLIQMRYTKLNSAKYRELLFKLPTSLLNQQQEETFHSHVGSKDLLNVAIAGAAGVALTSFGAPNIIQGSFQTKLRSH